MSSLNVLFVHGMWHGDWCWENFREHFRASHHVPFGQMPPFNLRNHGEPSRFTSPKAERRTPVRREGDGSQARAELELGAPVQGQTPDLKRLRWTGLGAYTADVVAAARDLPRPLVLIGHSMGAWIIARSLAQVRPDALVLLAPASWRSFWWSSFNYARHNFRRYLCANLRFSPYAVVENPREAGKLLFSPHLPESELYAHHGRLQEESYLVNLQMLSTFPPYRQVPGLPVLVLGAEHDGAVRPWHARATAAKLGAEVDILPGLAHDMMMDVAWQSAAERVVAWLEKLQKEGHFSR